MITPIAYIDDEPTNAEVMAHKLGSNYKIDHFVDGQSYLNSLKNQKHQLLVIDVHMPGDNGYDTAKKIIEHPHFHGAPLLFVSYDISEPTVNRALLEMRAEYIHRDVADGELRARVEKLVNGKTELSLGELKVDIYNLKATVYGQPVDLTLKEFKILTFLMTRPNYCVHRQQLLAHIWGGVSVSDKTLNSHLSNLRAKIADARVHLQIDRSGMIEICLKETKA